MAKQFRLRVYTQEAQILDEPATSVMVPGSDGYIGILADHAPLIATLGSGQLRIRREHAEKEINISGGFLEVANNEVTVLADAVTGPET